MGLFHKKSAAEKEANKEKKQAKKAEKQAIRAQKAAENKARREAEAAAAKARQEAAAAKERARKEQERAEYQKQLDEYTYMREKAVHDGNISTVNELDWYIKRVKAQMRGDKNEVFMCTREIVALEERRGGVTHRSGDGLACRPYDPYGDE